MKSKMYLHTGKIIAGAVIEALRPHCIRIEIAGSIRREKEIVGDIEVVCIPKPYETGLFTSGIALIVNEWQKLKGELEYGKTKYTQRLLPGKLTGFPDKTIAVDLFFCTEANWASIFLIRTGDWEFSKKFMGTIMPQQGFKQFEGFVTKGGDIVEVKEEEELFALMNIPFIEPKNRNAKAL